jgi:hypothetical protein
MPSLTSYGPIKCAASNTRLSPPWGAYSVELRQAYEGDVVLVEALADSGAYAEIENAAGRSEQLYRGDLFLAVVGNRQSSKYLCGSVPGTGFDTAAFPELHLLSNGGIVGKCEKSPEYLGSPLALRCHGVLTEDDQPINTIKRNVSKTPSRLAPLILIAASATDAGKTTLASRLVATLSHDHGLHVAAAKLAGTGCLEDILQHRDAGARWIADFPDVGLPSTYTSEENYIPALRSLLHGLASHGPDVVVAELGGDLIWANIPTLLRLPDVMESVLGLVIIPSDVLSAIGIQFLLNEWSVSCPVTWVTPPSCNHASFKLRMDCYVPGELIDCRNRTDIGALATRFATAASEPLAVDHA